MTQNKPENPQAFPMPQGMKDNTFEGNDEQEGMTLRDWFAGQALISAKDLNPQPFTDENLAKAAYSMADAMLKERAKS